MSMVRGLFVTGTDTGVGKTVLTAALAASLRAEKLNIGVWKPVQSGALLGTGITDAERLLEGSGINELPGAVAPFTFEAPLTPLLAAKQAGVTLTMEALIAAGEPLIERYDALLIEGAGGAAVPLTDNALVVDLITELRIPALIVARSGLGTINHTLLTVSFLQQRAIPIVGVIMNDGESAETYEDSSVCANAELIERFSGIKVLGRFPRLSSEVNTETLIKAVRDNIQLTPLKQVFVVNQ